MTDAPASNTFPYVQECPDCDGAGWELIESDEPIEVHSWGGEVVRYIAGRHAVNIPCIACEGRGRIIPPEWTQQQ